MDIENWKLASDHAWRYFELHANQRMAIFNFFTVMSAAVVAGIAATQSIPRVGVALGLALVVLSFVSWKLDQRVALLVKHAEESQALAEQELLPQAARLFTLEPEMHQRALSGKNLIQKPWTYGRSFRITFVLVGLMGLGWAGMSIFSL